jgi:Acyl-CoA thioesterase C-terminal domain
VLVAADSGSGVSVALDWTRYLFINVDLSVHLHRMPEGEWVCLDAVTLPEPSGIGMADRRLFDERGRDRQGRSDAADRRPELIGLRRRAPSHTGSGTGSLSAGVERTTCSSAPTTRESNWVPAHLWSSAMAASGSRAGE